MKNEFFEISDRSGTFRGVLGAKTLLIRGFPIMFNDSYPIASPFQKLQVNCGPFWKKK